jgi:hypothetical protein
MVVEAAVSSSLDAQHALACVVIVSSLSWHMCTAVAHSAFACLPFQSDKSNSCCRSMTRWSRS